MAPSPPQGFRRALRYLVPYWRLEVLGISAALLTTCLALIYPWVNKLLIDEVIVRKDVKMLWTVCALFFGAAILQGCITIGQRYLFATIGERAVVDLRHQVMGRLLELSAPYFQSEKTGRVMSLFTSDIPGMQRLYTSTLVDFLADSLRLAVTAIVLLSIDWQLTALALPVFALFTLCLRRFGKPSRQISRAVQDETASLSGHLQEALAGIREIKAFRQEPATGRRFLGLFRRLLGLRARQELLGAGLNGVAEAVAMTGVVICLLAGGMKAVRGEMQMGVLVAFVNYLGGLFGPVARFTEMNNRVQAAMGSAERVFQFLDGTESLREKREGERVARVRGGIELRDLRFAYEAGQEVLHGIDLTVAPGELVALVGPSGSGKTTLALLLFGFHRDYEGSFRVDGVELRDVDLDALRSEIGAVFQETFLFDTTVAENIRLGRPGATREEVEAAARTAHAHELIAALPQGYETRLGERGLKLSGGQRQRIAIARAVLLDPKILILDEATSALDAESEALIQQALDELMAGRTSLVIAHRLATIRRADKIVVLSGGEIREVGSHEELFLAGGLYRGLYDRQVLGTGGGEGACPPAEERLQVAG